MTEYQNTVTNPDAPWSSIPDTEENIFLDLECYTLDPVFELYGNFVNPSPEWLSEDVSAKYAGCTSISGNFLYLSHAFRLVTDDPGLISRLSAAIARNKATPEYQAARQRMLDKLPALTKQTAHEGQTYAWPGGWLKLTRVYRLTEQEANDSALLYLDRWEGIDHNGTIHGAAFHDGDQLSTTANWKL